MTGFIKSFSLALIFIFSVSFAQAQRGNFDKTPEERAELQTAKMTESLALSDAQVEKIKAVNLEYAKKRSEARKNADGDWASIRESMRTNRQAQKTALKKYLTTEQAEKWDKLEAERRQNRGKRGNKKKQ